MSKKTEQEERKEDLRDAMLVEIARGVEMLLDDAARRSPMAGANYSSQSGRIRGTRELLRMELPR